MTADFSHFQKLEVRKDATSEYELVELGENAPVLEGVFAGEKNRTYQNALLKRATRNARRLRSGRLTGRELRDNRDHDRELYPVCVIKRWRLVVDKNGKEVDFSEDNCFGFLEALPDHIFDDVRNHFSNPTNFIEDAGMEGEELEDLGNVSPPDFVGTSATSETAGP